jgi:hypothetical protein
LQLWRFFAVAAIGLPLVAVGYIWNHLRAARVRFATVSVSALDGDGAMEDEAAGGAAGEPATADHQAADQAQITGVIYSPTPVPPVEEKTLTSEPGQEQQPAQSQADEQIRRGVSEFSQTLQDLTASICGAVDKLGGDVGQALAGFAAEQRAALRRQEELLAETRRVSEQVQADAERASQAATQASSSRSSASEMLTRLQEDRNGLTQLINDVRNRIAALSVLAAPMPDVAAPANEPYTTPDSASEGEEPPATPSWST